MSEVVSFTALRETARASPPAAALVLGSGLSALAQRLSGARSVFFGDVPGLAGTSVAGHKGCVSLGEWAGRSLLVFEGRLHYYEGHAWRRVVEPIHLARELGARVLILTNAAGGIHEALGPGSLLAIRDHIEWTRPYAWRTGDAAGASRPNPYSPRLLELLRQAAENVKLPLLVGTYAQVTGPSYDTPAEIRGLKAWGADAVGMSTAHEIRIGHELGLECAALSGICNRAAGLGDGPITHEDVLRIGCELTDKAGRLLEEFLRLLD